MKTAERTNKDRIKVCVRLRNNKECVEEDKKILEVEKNKIILREEKNFSTKNTNSQKIFCYDQVLDKNCKNEEIFEKSALFVLEGLFLGYTGTIFSYGQSNSGKSHTINSVIESSLEYIFTKIKNDKKFRYNIFIGQLAIYLERVKLF